MKKVSRIGLIRDVVERYGIRTGEYYIDRRKVGMRYKLYVYDRCPDKLFEELESIPNVVKAKYHASYCFAMDSTRDSICVYFDTVVKERKIKW